MHRLFEKLKPAFFRAWDQKLLLNRPGLWATKFHYALMFGLLGLALSSLSIWLLPIELTAVPNAWSHLLYAMIPSAIGLAIWIWQVSLFKTDKAFGEATLLNTLRDQGIYVSVLLMVVLIPALHGYQLSQKVAHRINESELIADIDQLNLIDPLTYYYDVETESPSKETLIRAVDAYHFGQYRYYDYRGQTAFNKDLHERLLTLLEGRSQEALYAEIEQYLHLIEKYSRRDFSLSAQALYSGFLSQKLENDSFEVAQMEARDNLILIQESLSNQNHLLGNKGPFVLTVFFFWGLGLLLIGLQSNGRSFLLSAIAGGVLLILGGFAAEFLAYDTLRSSHPESWLSFFHLLTMGVLGLLVLRRKTTQKGILWRQVVLTLFVVGLAFIPLSLWQLLFELNGPFCCTESAFRRQDVFEYLLLGGALLPLLLWNLGLRQSFIRLHVRPKTR